MRLMLLMLNAIWGLPQPDQIHVSDMEVEYSGGMAVPNGLMAQQIQCIVIDTQ